MAQLQRLPTPSDQRPGYTALEDMWSTSDNYFNGIYVVDLFRYASVYWALFNVALVYLKLFGYVNTIGVQNYKGKMMLHLSFLHIWGRNKMCWAFGLNINCLVIPSGDFSPLWSRLVFSCLYVEKETEESKESSDILIYVIVSISLVSNQLTLTIYNFT